MKTVGEIVSHLNTGDTTWALAQVYVYAGGTYDSEAQTGTYANLYVNQLFDSADPFDIMPQGEYLDGDGTITVYGDGTYDIVVRDSSGTDLDIEVNLTLTGSTYSSCGDGEAYTPVSAPASGVGVGFPLTMLITGIEDAPYGTVEFYDGGTYGSTNVYKQAHTKEVYDLLDPFSIHPQGVSLDEDGALLAYGAGTYDIVVKDVTGAVVATFISFVATGTSKFTCDSVISVPVTTLIDPDEGPVAGGTSITITGTGFTAATEVTIGGKNATTVYVGPTELTVTSPAGSETGAVDVYIVNKGAYERIPNGFTYIPVKQLLIHGNATIQDDSGNDYSTVVGASLAVNTTSKKFGAGSVWLDEGLGSSSLSWTTDLAIGTGEYTFDFWMYVPVSMGAGTLVTDSNISLPYPLKWFLLFTNSGADLTISTKRDVSTVSQVVAGTNLTSGFIHFAETRSGTTVRWFVDGVEVRSFTSSYNVGASQGFQFRAPGAGGQFVDEVHLIKSCQWTAGFTPPTGEY